jgi:hypothetical protein
MLEPDGWINIRCRRPDQEHPRTLYTPFVGISNTDVSIINDLRQIVGIGEISLGGGFWKVANRPTTGN